MGIVVKGSNRCVFTAVSTIRGFLGYKTSLPRFMSSNPNVDTITEWIAENAHRMFPKHKIRVWTLPELSHVKGYSGTQFGNVCNKNSIIMFEYHKNGSTDGHMVVGAPCLYDDMVTSIVVAVEAKNKFIGQEVNHGH